MNAVDRNDINTFRSALNSVSAAEKSKIFEYVCQTPDRAKFIKECISSGCDVNEVCVYIHSISYANELLH